MTAVDGADVAAGAPDAAAAATATSGERDFRLELLLPRGRYTFKFLADGARWLVGSAHASAVDARGNANNAVDAGAPGAGHAHASASEAAAWAAGPHRLALVRGAAAAVAMNVPALIASVPKCNERSRLADNAAALITIHPNSW